MIVRKEFLVFAALPPLIAERLRLSGMLFIQTCGEAERRRNSRARVQR